MSAAETDPGLARLAAFGAWCVREFREHLGDVDGGSAQEEMERLGVLIVHPVAESCGESCSCAEVGFPTDCYRLADEVRKAMARSPLPAATQLAEAKEPK